MNYTKGKWKEADGFIHSEEADPNLYVLIADVSGLNGEGLDPTGDYFAGNYTPEGEEANANIDLICASPKLLEALQNIIEIDKRDMSNPKYDMYFEEAQQAISEALGR